MTWYVTMWFGGYDFMEISALGVVHPSNLCPNDHQLTGRWFRGRILRHQSPDTQLEWPQLGDIPPFSDKATYHLVGSRFHEYPIPLYISTVAHIWCQVGLPIIHQSFHPWFLPISTWLQVFPICIEPIHDGGPEGMDMFPKLSLPIHWFWSKNIWKSVASSG